MDKNEIIGSVMKESFGFTLEKKIKGMGGKIMITKDGAEIRVTDKKKTDGIMKLIKKEFGNATLRPYPTHDLVIIKWK